MSQLSSNVTPARPITILETALQPAVVANTPCEKVTNSDRLVHKAMVDLYPINSEQNQNPEPALKLLNEAADLQHKVALTLLGKIYENGKFGVEINYEKAASLYKKASDLGFGEASYRYGQLCLNGNIVGQDVSIAYDYLKLASQQGYQQPIPADRDSILFDFTGPPRNRFMGPVFG